MKIFKKIINKELFKNYNSLFVMFLLMNSLITFGSENKSNSFNSDQKNAEFEIILNENSIPFSEHDNLSSQFKTFFGYYPRLAKSFK